jgi:gamma-butyrobetaine dioxygenase
VDELVGWLLAVGRRTYDGRATLLEHSLRTAALARLHGARESQVVAALLHDVGHPLGDVVDASVSARSGHERLGATWLARVYPEAITEPIRLHVEAKRWLVAFEPGYAATLSMGSRAALEDQGGPMRPEERSVFEAEPYAAAALSLRRWDEEAVTYNGELPLLETFRPALLRQLRGAR